MGNGLSQLTEEQIAQLKETTPFKEEDMVKLLKRYGQYDDTDKGTDGIPYKQMVAFPELQTNPLIPRLLELYINRGNRTLYAEKFLYFFALLSKDTPIRDKRDAAFQCFDLKKRGWLGRQEVYQMYSLMYKTAVSSDVLLTLTERALSHPNLTQPGQLSQDEFQQMISDWEIANLFTLELQTG